MKRIRRTPRARVRRPTDATTARTDAPADKAGPASDSQPFVNRVVLDNTVPGGFRYEQVPVHQA